MSVEGIFNLNNKRISDKDAQRQEETVKEIISRYKRSPESERFELQILADEVGLGKTYVALGTAAVAIKYARANRLRDFQGCIPKVLVVPPQNHALIGKWTNEVNEFNKWCISDQSKWLTVQKIDYLEDLVAALRTSVGPNILIAGMGIFTRHISNYSAKRRLTLGALFRIWSNGFTYNKRYRLIRGAPRDWPADPSQYLSDFSEIFKGSMVNPGPTSPVNSDDFAESIRSLYKTGDQYTKDVLQDIFLKCQAISEKYVHKRNELFRNIEQQLTHVYKHALRNLINSHLPLLIVDEAHNWKNGRNGFGEFKAHIFPISRRALLLTATPFQLDPHEILRILDVHSTLAISADHSVRAKRRKFLKEYIESTVTPVLSASVLASHRFSKAWSDLDPAVDRQTIEDQWTQVFGTLKNRLEELANLPGALSDAQIRQTIDSDIAELEPKLKSFFNAALQLFARNKDLSKELGALVIRHRRMTQHRLFKVGQELHKGSAEISKRGDYSILHAAPGIDVKGEAEIPHYLLMRTVSEVKRSRGKHGRSSLGSNLTGCYSTLKASSEGQFLSTGLANIPQANKYAQLLSELISEDKDEKHPKVSAIVDFVVKNWHQGNKSLIFCFRVNTAEKLREIIESRILKETDAHRAKVMGGEKQFSNLQRRLGNKYDSLYLLTIDRVLLSLLIHLKASGKGYRYFYRQLRVDHDLVRSLTQLSLEYGFSLFDHKGEDKKADRLVLCRCIEHLLSKRIMTLAVFASWSLEVRMLLRTMSDTEWFTNVIRAGSELNLDEVSDEQGQDIYSGNTALTFISNELLRSQTEKNWQTLERIRSQGKIPLIESYFNYPSYWFGMDPLAKIDRDLLSPRALDINERIWQINRDASEAVDLVGRDRCYDLLKTIVNKETLLVRMLPDRADRSWSEMLVESFYQPMPGQIESLVDRVTIFLDDLANAGGSLSAEDEKSGGFRYAMYEMIKIRSPQAVELVKGGDNERRARIFQGFNTPLLPEILVCTSVGQEGIDLHRHCRHVIHYDLAWNPASIEQRTGRVDRIGSKIERIRKTNKGNDKYLEIVVPYLAGTYDERMYEQLKMRAQVFEVITGGDLGQAKDSGITADQDYEGVENEEHVLSLPLALINDLRVRLGISDS